ncbi:unnamed protein product [Rhizopus stolonifer]
MMKKSNKKKRNKDFNTLCTFVGFNITFFFYKSAHREGLVHFQRDCPSPPPQFLEGLPLFFTQININKLLDVNQDFWTFCQKSDNQSAIEERYEASQVSFEVMIDASQDIIRLCMLRFG